MYDFYSHTPHGVQHIKQNLPRTVGKFLLTHPSRGATTVAASGMTVVVNFYSHTPHGVQPATTYQWYQQSLFLLTHPSRGATGTAGL